MENIYLVFIEYIGLTVNEKYIYKFHFSERPEVVWGDYWNVCPSSVIPNIKPDINSINKIYEVELDYRLNLAIHNSCFSMQDCIDQIIALGWFDIDSDIFYEDEINIMKFRFGENFETVEKYLKFINVNMDNIVYEKSDDSDEMIDKLIDKLGGQNNDELGW